VVSRPSTPLVLIVVRHVIPAAVVLLGVVWFALEPSVLAAEGAAGVVGAGMAWWLFGWLYRKGVEGEADRDDEDAVRAFFDEHGRWPTDAEEAQLRRRGATGA